jgi:hypothetical protein
VICTWLSCSFLYYFWSRFFSHITSSISLTFLVVMEIWGVLGVPFVSLLWRVFSFLCGCTSLDKRWIHNRYMIIWIILGPFWMKYWDSQSLAEFVENNENTEDKYSLPKFESSIVRVPRNGVHCLHNSLWSHPFIADFALTFFRSVSDVFLLIFSC